MSTVTYNTDKITRTLERLDNVKAFCLSEKAAGNTEQIKKLGEDIFAGKTDYSDSTDDECTKAFLSAGWAFVKPSDQCKKTVAQNKLPDEAYAVGTLCRDKYGHVQVAMPTLNVRMDPGLNPEQIKARIESLGYHIIHDFTFDPQLFTIGIKFEEDPFEVAELLLREGSFKTAEPDFVEYVRLRARPSEGEISHGWQVANIQADKAWDIADGSGVRVAVIDNGFDLKHPDLRDDISELSGFYQSRLFGFRKARFVRKLEGLPDKDHGTRCAGMALARANSQHGVGIAFGSELIAISCLNDQLGSQSTLARAIAYAADPSREDTTLSPDQGAHVISCSLGPDGADWPLSTVLRSGLDFAATKGRNGRGTPIFWAVPNNNEQISSPDGTDEISAYEHTISVGISTDADREDGSGFGPELDFLAPGKKVQIARSLSRGGGTARAVGTSFATPCAAGVAALMLGANPELPTEEIRRMMRESCDKVGGDQVEYDTFGRHEKYGSGRVNALKAVEMATGRR